MLTSELIADLTALLAEHGDLPVTATVNEYGSYTGGPVSDTWHDGDTIVIDSQVR